MHLVDRSRPDPWVPAQSARELMIQLWYPARDVRRSPRAPWVGPALAALLNPPGSGFELPVTHAHTGAPAAGRRPVVLYSPGFGHLSFTDYQVLLPQTGAAPADLEPALGTIDGGRSVRVQRAYLLAFADRYLGGRGGTLLSGPSAGYPEMRFLP
ncbi:hypothetical protein AB0H83_12505 [Dactylosporangium sp. NPDC050688]|uniref:hypothetical protein n=1 Tax=Dactylosporangium sp. NPDC050688 TaxID=3157217 RepID=UPI0033FF80CC